MKKQVHLAVLWLCLWMGWGAQAQEFTRDVDFKDFYSYVREVRRGEYLFFNDYEAYTNFHYYRDGDTMVTNVYTALPRRVRDFEIMDKRYVFFCADTGWWGYDSSGLFPHAICRSVVGVFDVDEIPTGTVNVRMFGMEPLGVTDTMVGAYKMEVYKKQGHVHVVATGLMQDGTGGVAEVSLGDVEDNSPCFIRIAKSELTDQEVFYDVAVTERYVVTTSYIGSSQRSAVRLFRKPADCTTSIFDGYNDERLILPFVAKRVLVRHINVDTFAVAAYESGSHSIMVSLYDGATMIGSVRLPTTWSNAEESPLRDMDYSPLSRRLNLLSTYMEGTDTASEVRHLPIPFPSTVTIAGHKYPSETLHSIDCSQFDSSYIIASGHHIYPYNQLAIYRLMHNAALGCNERIEVPLKKYTKQGFREVQPLINIFSVRRASEKWSVWPSKIYIKCKR